jgi:hypothetical protein
LDIREALTASCLTCTLIEVLIYVEGEVAHLLRGKEISSVSSVRRDNEVRVAEKTLTKLPVKEALPGWVIKRRGRVVRGEGKGGRDLGRRIQRGVIESGEILIRVVDVDGVKIHFGWVPERVFVREVMIGVVEEVGGRKGGGITVRCSPQQVIIVVVVVVFKGVVIIIMVIVYRLGAAFSWIGLRRQEGLSRKVQFRHCWCPYGLPKSRYRGSVGLEA